MCVSAFFLFPCVEDKVTLVEAIRRKIIDIVLTNQEIEFPFVHALGVIEGPGASGDRGDLHLWAMLEQQLQLVSRNIPVGAGGNLYAEGI
jgi:hypothetical protein